MTDVKQTLITFNHNPCDYNVQLVLAALYIGHYDKIFAAINLYLCDKSLQ